MCCETDKNRIKKIIDDGKAVLGIEFGSTRIKTVLIDESCKPIAQGSFEWENRLENGFWTYHDDEILLGLQSAYKALAEEIEASFGTKIKHLAAMGISAMMHGYLVFDKNDRLLVPFRTWRNTTTSRGAKELTERFNFNIPQRWSIAHLYQAILDKENHVGDIAYMTTLAGYVHYILTGRKVLGAGDASGMFPVAEDCGYDKEMLKSFQKLIEDRNYPWTIEETLPEIISAGENAGVLTAQGARLLDPTGNLQAGIPLCPPEGDAGTGMTATNSVEAGTGNVSAGTSVFAMIVLDRPLKMLHTELDMVTTPCGKPVAMVHCNNCTSDLNEWISLFAESYEAISGVKPDMNLVYEKLYTKALDGTSDCDGLLSFNCVSGEPVINLDEGTPLFIRNPQAKLSLGNFMRSNLYSACAALKIGMDILTCGEGVCVQRLTGHGGLFKTKGVAQKFMSAALKTPVSVMETAGEGGPWGMALLAAQALR